MMRIPVKNIIWNSRCSFSTTKNLSFYSSEHIELQNNLDKIIKKDIIPFVDEWEEKGIFPAKKLFKTLGSAGFLGIDKPTEYGGLGLDYSYQVAFLEQLGTVPCGGVPMAIGVQCDMSTPALIKYGTDTLKAEFLQPTITGDKVACVGISEPGAGSDVAQIKTTAIQKGGDYIINGSKMWITNGMQSDWICLLANTSKDKNVYKSKSLICVPMDLPGIQRTMIHKIGNYSSDTAQIFFEDVRVPKTNIIGEEGMGFIYQMEQFQIERLAGIAFCLKGMEIAINETIKYTRDRHVFGQPLLNNQVIHFRLAELQTEVELLRSLLYRAAELYMKDEDVTLLASMGKLKAGRLVRQVADSCLQYWGGMGYTKENLISRMFRDTRLMSIAGGADEVMLGIICKFMGTLPKISHSRK